jgi:hypothetical protein
MSSWSSLAWSWSADEIIDSPTSEATPRVVESAPVCVQAPPKRSRKKKLKFAETDCETLNRQFLKIANGEEKVSKTFFFFFFFLNCCWRQSVKVSEPRQKKVEAVQRLELHSDGMAERLEWIAERELFAPGCAEFDFDDDELQSSVCASVAVVPSRPRDVRGAGPSLSDIVGVKTRLSELPAPPLSPIKGWGVSVTPKLSQIKPELAPPKGTKRAHDIEDIFA